MARILAVDDEPVSPVDDRFVAVARQVPHHDLVALLDLLAANLPVLQRSAAHVSQRRLPADDFRHHAGDQRSEEHTSELQSLMRISYAVFCLKKKNTNQNKEIAE